MDAGRTDDGWTSGDAYESYVGHWSRAVAREFLDWLAVADGRRWLDVGCGTGALSEEILETASPSEVVGIDLSPAYIAYARDHVAIALNADARALDEGPRFGGICHPAALADLFEDAGLGHVESRVIDVPTHFVDFEDFWRPFLREQGPAPAYVASLDGERRTALRERLRADLPVENDGSIHLMTRAFAVRGRRGAA